MRHSKVANDAVLPLSWTRTSGNNIPPHAVPLCEGPNGHLYIARGLLRGEIHMGITCHASCAGARLYHPDGRSYAVFEYEVLTCASTTRIQSEARQPLAPAVEVARTSQLPDDRYSASTKTTESPLCQTKLKPFPWLWELAAAAEMARRTHTRGRSVSTTSTASSAPQTPGKLKPFSWLQQLSVTVETARETPVRSSSVSATLTASPSPRTSSGKLKPFPWLQQLVPAAEAVTMIPRLPVCGDNVSMSRTASPPSKTTGKLKPFPWLQQLASTSGMARSTMSTRTTCPSLQAPGKLKPFAWLHELTLSEEKAQTTPRLLAFTNGASSTGTASPQTRRKPRLFSWLRPLTPVKETAKTTSQLRVRTGSVSPTMNASPRPQTPKLKPFPWLLELRLTAKTAETNRVHRGAVATTKTATPTPRTPEKPAPLPLLQPLTSAAELAETTPWLPAYRESVSTARAASPPPGTPESLTSSWSGQTRGVHSSASLSVITNKRDLLQHLSNRSTANEAGERYSDDPPPYPGPIGGRAELPEDARLITLSARGCVQFDHLAQSKCFVLIDDSPSMQYSWLQTREAATGLVDILSSNSKWDGLDVRFLHHAQSHPCVKTTQEFESVFDSVSTLRGKKTMAAKVSQVFDESLPLICDPFTPTPVNLLIMTDNAPSDNRELLEAIIRFRRELNEKCIPPHMFRVHLMQMGHDRRAVKSLHDFRDRVTQRDRDRRILKVVNFHRARGLLDAEKVFKSLLASTFIPIEDPDIGEKLRSKVVEEKCAEVEKISEDDECPGYYST